MTPEDFQGGLRRAAAAGDWHAAERLGRAYGWSLLLGALRRTAARLAERLPRPRPRRPAIGR